jgi:hypothetical protein
MISIIRKARMTMPISDAMNRPSTLCEESESLAICEREK